MKKFIQVSLCVAMLGSTVVKAHKDGMFDHATDAAKGAGVAAFAGLLATEKGRNTLADVVAAVAKDKKGDVNTKNLGVAGATGLAAYLMQQYKLHDYLRNVPAVGETVADFVDDHKYGVATGVAIVMFYALNQMANS